MLALHVDRIPEHQKTYLTGESLVATKDPRVVEVLVDLTNTPSSFERSRTQGRWRRRRFEAAKFTDPCPG